MSVKHLLVPQDRYEALLSIEEKYFSQQQQHREGRAEEGDRGTEDVSEESTEQPGSIREQEESEVGTAVKPEAEERDLQIGEGPASSKSNLGEEELSLLRPPGIPVRRAPLKKWLVWRQ